jgi:hypothetical protein
MNWFLVKLVYQIICGEGMHMPQFDEQLRIIVAGDEAEALSKAAVIGEAGSEAFFNHSDKLVQWKFVNVAELHRMSEWIDGAELYSSVLETDNADDYISFVNDKASRLAQRYHSLQLINLI